MAAKFPFTTHVGLIIDVEKDGDEWLLTLTGDIVKPVAHGNMGTVMAEANKLVAHYQERAEAEA